MDDRAARIAALLEKERNKPGIKVKCTISYDGTRYGGYQIQHNALTVQELIEQAIEKVAKEPITTYASGRTDAGVHARGQVFHFRTTCRIPVDKWPNAINKYLPDDIYVLDAEQVPGDFHARYNVKEKTYRYCLMNSQWPNVLYQKFAWHVPYKLNFEAMREAATYFLGTHDFTTFCSMRTVIEDRVRDIYDISIEQGEDGQVWMSFRGSGFLYNMVRIMVGTLVSVGTGKYKPTDIHRMIEAKDRFAAGQTAPAHGLILWEVKY